MNKHWSEEDLIDQLYGIGPADSHLDDCEECRVRWIRIRERRSLVLEQPDLSPEFLVAQRQAIYRRLEGRRSGGWAIRLSPALAALGVIVVGVLLTSRPSPAPQPVIASNDSEFFTEIYTMVESPEPWAAEPMYGLFED